MNTTTDFLKQYDTRSTQRIITSVSMAILESSDPLQQANSVITNLGVSPLPNEVDARVVALALVEQAYKAGSSYDVNVAIPLVEKRYAGLAKKIPYGHDQMEVKLSVLSESAEKAVAVVTSSEKHVRAKEIYDRLIGTTSKNKIVKTIAEELNITTGNAGFLVYRKFAGKS